MKRSLLVVVGAVALAFLTGCETTGQGIPQQQLKANFAQVRLGMTKDQIAALIGRPANMNAMLDASGSIEQWIYTESQFWTVGQALVAGMSVGPPGNVPSPRRVEGKLVLTFKNSRLAGIQGQR